MKPNALKRAWNDGRSTINGWLSVGNSYTAEVMAEQGYDSLTIDLQHGFLDYSDAKGMLQALRASGVTPLVRVPWLEPGVIMKCLDGGAYGVICPMVNTADEAAQFVEYMRYPPKGTRSFGPIRANFSAGPDYYGGANDEVLAFAMIETGVAVENVEAICATEGLDGIYIGPSDLSLGVTQGRLQPGQDRREPEMLEVIQRILEAAKAAGLRAAIHTGSASYAGEAIGWGFDMVTIEGDALLMARAARESVAEARALIGQSGPGEKPDGGGY
ncbi:MAG: aldolase/citrate lyase family protein [Pseudomonadota bacterium]